MEDRYEIKSKIGQGGFGSVYRAVDKRMNREVAIKRINTSDEDGMLEEASRQLSKEAGALASMQHPNIITIYDVGSDEDGPYVVMELLTGSPLDELVDTAPLTWEDFRELALQTQEALIGAQELDLVHRDIKPANVMLTWLPSGKFQVKLLDFGLAKLTQRPSLQTLNQADSIFGSIFFMSPEQFERNPIDRRTDMYAMGCVYYYALTGSHPFDGATAVEVMSAHLHHDFVPLDELRPDLPRWVSDWVMWHMNRYPDDRPESAREALQVFIQNDKYPPVEVPAAAPAPAPEQTGRPRLLIPGAEPLVPGAVPEKKVEATGVVKVSTKTAPQPLIPPTSKPSIHSSRQIEIEQAQTPDGELVEEEVYHEEQEIVQSSDSADEMASEFEPDAVPGEVAEDVPEEEAAAAQPAPKKFIATQKRPTVSPPTGGVPAQTSQVEPTHKTGPTLIRRPSLVTGKQPEVTPLTGTAPVIAKPQHATSALVPTKPATGPQSATAAATSPIAGNVDDPVAVAGTAASEGAPTAGLLVAPAKTGISNGVKIAAAVLIGLLIVFSGWLIVQKLGDRKVAGEFNDMLRLAAHPETQSVPMNKAMLDRLLNMTMTVSVNNERETMFRALFLATSTDGTNIDLEIVRFATEREMMDNVRNILIGQVLRRRESPAIVVPMLEFAAKTDKEDAAVAALQSVKSLVDESHFDTLLNTLQFTTNVEIRRAAEEALVGIIESSGRPLQYASKLHGIIRSSVNDDARFAALRLTGYVADDASLGLIREILSGRVVQDKIAAIGALAVWKSNDGFPLLMDFYNSTEDPQMRTRAFDSGVRYAAVLDERKANEEIRRDVWGQLASNARTPEEQERIVRALAVNHRDDWIVSLIQNFTKNDKPGRVIDVAERALSSIKARRSQEAN